MNLFDPPELGSERLLLAPIAPGDAPAIQRLFTDDPLVTCYVAWQPLTDPTRAQRFVEREARAWAEADDCRGWTARLRETGEAVASAVVKLHGETAEFSYVVERAHWNRGYATELARCILERARRDPGLVEVWAVCDIDNMASRRVLEKAGMSLDRILSAHQRHNFSETPRDCCRFCVAVGGRV